MLSDPAWRLQNLYYIVDKNAQRVKFTPNPIQRRLNECNAQRRVVLKARQFGISTNELLRLYDYTIWNENVTTCILAHEKDSIEKLFRIVRRAHNFMDPHMKPEIDRGGGSKYEMFFPEINSRIYCDLESRGDTVHWLHISEAAFFKEPDRMKSTMQAVPLTGKITIETTPNGMGNHFYDFWTDPKQPYEKLFYPWFLFPEYSIATRDRLELTLEEQELQEKAMNGWGMTLTDGQIAFRRLKQGELGLLFIQEYPEDDQSCFLASGHAAMDLTKVKAMMDRAEKPIQEDRYVKIWERPSAGGIYVAGADCAEGVGGDSSVGVVLNARTLRQVAVLRGQLKPSEFARRLVDLCKKFENRGNLPELAVERNNHGHAVLLELDEHLHYPNLFKDKDDRLGWLTDKVSRPIMIDAFIDGVEHNRLKLEDPDTLRECLTLVVNEGKIEADVQKNDDCVFATAIALQLALEHSRLADLYSDVSSSIRV
jgi:hypothetical protein